MSIQLRNANTFAANDCTIPIRAKKEIPGRNKPYKSNESSGKREFEYYIPDTDTIFNIKPNFKNNISDFKQIIYSVVKKQGGLADIANMVIDQDTQLSAQKSIAENGEWGVEAVTDRISGLAKTLSDGNNGRIAVLRDTVEKGFEAAARVWGGKLPGISQQTYSRVIAWFDVWEKGC